MMSLFCIIIFAVANFSIQHLPAVEHSAYASSNMARADRVFEVENESAIPIKRNIKSLGPQISAKDAIVVDAATGAVLYSKNENSPHTMASITKLMTTLVFLDKNPNLDDLVEMVEEDDREGGEDFIRPGESAKLYDYLVASLLGSSNNATIVLSRSVGVRQEEFVNLMNQKAKEIGMENTKFVEPSGLLPENISTARDLVKLLNEVSKNSVITEITGMSSDAITVYPLSIKRYINTTNHLIGSMVFVKFGKTGFLEESLYNLAAEVYYKSGRPMYVVVLGSQTNEDRVQDAKNLAVWAGEAYEWK